MMKKMRTRIASVLVICAMLLTMLPVSALAEEPEEGQITPPTELTGVEPDSGNGPAARSTPITSEENLIQAISQAQPGDVITLGGDIELTQCLTIDNAITLDGNGYTFTGTVPSGESFLSVTADGAFSLRNCGFEPSGKVTPNGFITIAATGPVSITGCTFGSEDAPQTGYIYNALEFSQSASYPVADGTTISGNTFYGTALRHNGINLYRFEEGATVTISNNEFVDLNWDTSNAIRLSNYSGAEVTVNMDGNTYSEHGTDTPDNKGWAGFFLFQNAGNGSGGDMTIHVTDLTYQGTADQLYVLYEDITSETTPLVTGDGSVSSLYAVNYDAGTTAPCFTAEWNGTYYPTLAAAVEAVATSSGKTGTVKLLCDASGSGIGLFNTKGHTGVDLTIDFGGNTYTCTDPAVGSTGTESQGFHLEKDNTVTLRNGTIQVSESSTDTQMLIQNYCDLTLEDLTLVGADITSYIISSNYGDMTLNRVSASGTKSGVVAIDLMHWLGTSYEGKAPTLTIRNGEENLIAGGIAVYCWDDATNNYADDCADKPTLTIYGGTFTKDVTAYCGTGYTCNGGEDGRYTVVSGGMAAQVGEPENGSVSAEVGGSYTGQESAGGSGDGSGSVDAGQTITINVESKDESVTSSAITINSDALTSVQEASEKNQVTNVEIVADVGTVTLDKQAWNTVTENAGGASVVLTIEETGSNGWTVSATADGEPVFSADDNPSGTITITVDYTQQNPDSTVAVYYVAESGALESMQGVSCQNGKLTWKTGHLSYFESVELGGDDEVVYNTALDDTPIAGTLDEALAAVTSDGGGYIMLGKTVTVTNTAMGSDKTASRISLPHNVTLDGDGHSIIAAADWERTNTEPSEPKNSILGVITDDAEVTIKDLTIQGNANTRHGINTWASSADHQPQITLENVTIQNCGTAALVVNNAVVTATNLTTSGNPWGAVNVDKSGTFTLLGQENSMSEPAKIWTEAPAGSGDPNETVIHVSGSNFADYEVVKGVGENLKGSTYYTDDVADLGEAYNETTKTVYEDLKDALAAAGAGETVAVVKDAELTEDAQVNEDVTLVIRSGVELTITDGVELTNRGTIENNGTVSGTVNNGGDAAMTSTVTFSLTPANATVSVKNSANGQTVAGTGTTYQLENGSYTYTVSADGYYSKSGSFTVSGNAQTISVALTRVDSGSTTGGSSGGSSDDGDYAVKTETGKHGTITVTPGWADRGDKVTITVKPDDGYELKELTVTDQDGDTVELTRKGSNKYTFTMPASKVIVTAAFAEEGEASQIFTDVPQSAYYYDAVLWAVENGVTTGTTATTFSPNASCTRAQMVTFLWRAAGSPAPDGSTAAFADVPESAYYYDAVLWAVENGITAGTTDTTFSPDVTVTRGQTVTFLYRYAGSPAAVEGAAFTDVAADAYYAPAVQWAVEHGVTTGIDGQTFGPANSCTRGQIVTFLYRYMGE